MCELDDGRILVVIQGIDPSRERAYEGEPETRMSLIGNIIEAVDEPFRRPRVDHVKRERHQPPSQGEQQP
jgi:hypothetical protein